MRRKRTNIRVLCDVNVLLALVYGGHEHHRPVVRWLDTVPDDGVLICRTSQAGLLRLLTIRSVMQEDVCTMAEAWRVYDQLLADSRFRFCSEPEGVTELWRALCPPQTVAPKKWTDAYLAAFAIAAGMRLVTLDRGFWEFRGLDVLILGQPTLNEEGEVYQTHE